MSVSGLRSIKDAAAESIGTLTCFVGKNSSGKSNVLRALSLFFNGEMENKRPLNFARDYYEETPRRRIKKKITIKVSFAVPVNFNFRKELQPLSQLGQEFSITRWWEINPTGAIESNFELTGPDGVAVLNGADLARQFLGLIFFRYIPNRSVPSALLKEESQAIASSIFSRMKGDKHSAALLSSLTDAASRLLEPATASLEGTGSPITRPSVATQGSIGEMLTMSGFTATGQHGLAVQDEDWGSGHQAFFLYEVLKTLDTGYGRFFGWRQAAIWGVEEPESALHRDLESLLASQFRAWAQDKGAKLQILLTTHSPVFTMSSESGYWVELVDGATRLEGMTIPALTQASETKGVAGWVHPVLYFPWNPVVLVEGGIDSAVLEHVANLVGFSHLRFVTVPDLDTAKRRGGKDVLVSFLKSAASLIKNRAPNCPFVVLLDWDVSDQEMQQAASAYGQKGDRFVLRMDPAHADELVGKDFRGIERFYPPTVFTEAHASGDLILGVQAGKPYSIAKSQLEPAKLKLMERVKQIDDPSKLTPLVNILSDLATVTNPTLAIKSGAYASAGAASEP
jgi:hypothetical protein